MQKNGGHVKCKQCHDAFYIPLNRLGKALFCSYKCRADFMRGRPVTPEVLMRLREGFKKRVVPTVFKKGHRPWHADVPLKGEKASYSAIHYWIRKRKGSPKRCEHCGTKKAKRYEWAHIYHSVSRNLNEYIRLCVSCHVKFDAKC